MKVLFEKCSNLITGHQWMEFDSVEELWEFMKKTYHSWIIFFKKAGSRFELERYGLQKGQEYINIILYDDYFE